MKIRSIPYICLLPLALLAFAGVQAQSALRFSAATFDYGEVREDGGAVTCRFEAVNTSDKPLAVVEVMTSCGCTTPRYDRRPIQPDGRFELEIRYDPMNRPGRIDRSIAVRVSDSDEDIRLKIVGRVLPRQKSLEEIYPFDMGGGVRLESNFHAFAYVEHGKSVETRIGCVNRSDHPVLVRLAPVETSGALQIEYDELLAAGQTGDIVLRYRLAENSSRYGTMRDALTMVVDGIPSETLLTTQAVAVDNFDEAVDTASPKAQLPSTIVRFGHVAADSGIISQRVEIRNTGQAPLIIRKAESNIAAVRCRPEGGLMIPAGGSGSITVTFSPSQAAREGAFVSRVFVITNDPAHPMHTIRVNAIID